MKNEDMYVVGGSKGGVGKSLVAMALVDHLLEAGRKVFLAESDTCNPDVWKAYREHVPSELVNLDDADGWIQLVNLCDAHRESVVVVNTGARNNRGVAAYSETLNSTLDELGRRLTTIWVINRQRDSLELLRDYMDAVPTGQVHVMRNAYFGEEKQFELYNDSKIRSTVEEKGGFSVTFPDLADRVSDDLYTKRLPVSTAVRTLPIGNRAELCRWRREVAKVLARVVA